MQQKKGDIQILIVHDDQSLQKALKAKCEKEGFMVHTADNGEAGLSYALKHHPDLIVSDIMMPEKNGIAMVEALRKDDWGKGANIMLLTNSTESSFVAAALKNKVYDYLITANWKIEDVMKLIHKRLNV